MKTPARADIQRWSEEVARDPKSLAFLPLARAYRRQGRRDLAMQLVLRGLEAYPGHADAHGLLALLYLEGGDFQRAGDEWSTVLRIDPDNFDALRGMGFCYLEQDKLSRARQALERAALLRPGDATVQEALRVLGTRQELAERGVGGPRDASGGDDPWSAPAEPAAAPAPARGAASAGARTPTEPLAPPAVSAPTSAHRQASQTAGQGSVGDAAAAFADPAGLFDDLLSGTPLLGALLVDAQGLVLAGRLGGDGDADTLGAVLGGAVDEAARTVSHLALGSWRGMMLESEHAMLHLAPAAAGALVVLAARRNAPPGWIIRTSAQAVERAARYAEVYG